MQHSEHHGFIEKASPHGLGLVKPVSQVSFAIRTDDPELCFQGVRELILNWRNAQSGAQLPDDAMLGNSFEMHDVGGQRAAAVYLKKHKYWAARLDDADNQVAQRNWVTEVGLAIELGQGECPSFCV